MTVKGKNEYKLTIGSLSSETPGDKLFLKHISFTGKKLDPSTASITIGLNSSSLAVATDDIVRYYVREYGEGSWGSSLFTGYILVLSKDDEKGEITIEARALLQRAKDRDIISAAWGNTHIVDKEYAVTNTLGGTGEAARTYFDLDAGEPAQVPLEAVRALFMNQYVNGGTNPLSQACVWYVAAGADQSMAQEFIAQDGPLRKIWLKGYRLNNNAVDLKLEIQTDSNGAPSGTVVTSYVIPYTDFALALGWVEIDLLRHVTDPKKLNLTVGDQYWAVLTLNAADPSQIYYFEIFTSDPYPKGSFTLFNTAGAGWARIAGLKCARFGMDFEGDWEYTSEYECYGENNPPRVYLGKTDQVAGDGGVNVVKGKIPPLLFSGQKSARVSYWKGNITYNTVLQKWFDTVVSDIFTSASISVTNPTIKAYCIQIENANGLEALRKLRELVPFVIRNYTNGAGQEILEITDELQPTTANWNLYSAPQKAQRTVKSGNDTTTISEVKILDNKFTEEYLRENFNIAIRGAGGGILGAYGDGSMIGGMALISGLAGGKSSVGTNLSAQICDKRKTVRKGGSIKLGGVSQNTVTGPFRSPNELIFIVNSKCGINSVYSCEEIRWEDGIGKTAEITITLTDQTLDIYFSSLKAGGPTANAPMQSHAPGLGGLKDTLGSPVGNLRSEFGGLGKGIIDTPLVKLSDKGSASRAEDLISHKDGGLVYNDALFYWIRIGTGVPAGNNLGNQVAEILADVSEISVGEPLAALIGKFRPGDFGFGASFPMTITEIGIATSAALDGPKTAIAAKSLGVPSGTYTIFSPRPEITNVKALAVSYRIANPP